MTMRRSTALGSMASLVLAGVGAFAFYVTPHDFDPQFRKAVDVAGLLHQAALDWVMEISRVRADPDADFDRLSEFVPQVFDLRRAFSETMVLLPVSRQLAADGRAYVGAINALAERVERFKTAYSAIRNSVRYIPLASDALVEDAIAAGRAPLAQALRGVTAAIAAYVAAPAEVDARGLLARVELLLGNGHPDVMDDPLRGYVAHARVVLAEGPRLQAHLDAITMSEFVELASPLSGALEMDRIAHRNMVSLYRQGVFAAGAGILLVWVLVLFMRWRARSRSASPALVAPVSAPASPPAPSPVPGPVPVPEPEPAIEDLAHLFATDSAPVCTPAPTRTPAIVRTPDLIDAMIACGVLPGLMGQAFAARAHRLLTNLDLVRPEGDVAPEWARMCSDARLLTVLSGHMIVLGRHLAPKRLNDVDVNAVLTARLVGREVVPVCELQPVPRIEAPQAEVDLLVDACLEWASHCLRGLAPHDVKLTVTTQSHEEGVELAFTHDGGSLFLERGHAAFLPFATSRAPRTGLALPAVRYLARRLGGTANLLAPCDGQSTLLVHLPAVSGT